MNFTKLGRRSDVVDYMVFMDFFSKLDLELVNCYFSNIKGIFFTNFPVKSLKISNCLFDHIDSDSLHVTHPSVLSIKNSQFINCRN